MEFKATSSLYYVINKVTLMIQGLQVVPVQNEVLVFGWSGSGIPVTQMYSEQKLLLMLNVCTLPSRISIWSGKKLKQGRKTTSGYLIKAVEDSNVMNCALNVLKFNCFYY